MKPLSSASKLPREGSSSASPAVSATASTAAGDLDDEIGPVERTWLLRVAGVLIAIHLLLGLWSAASKTPTHDEYWHLPVGLLNITHGEFDFDLLNPPLARMWFALPLRLAGIRASAGKDPGDTGRRFHAEHADSYRALFFFGRSPNVLLSAGLAFLIFRWAWSLFGLSAAVGTLTLYVGCPNVLAHSAVATMDLPVALGMTATTWALWRWIEAPGWKRASLWGILLGLSLATKYTALMMLPFPLLAAVILAKRSGIRRTLLGQLALGLVLMVVALDGCYLFQNVGTPLRDLPLQSAAIKSIQARLSFLGGCPVPVARDYVMGVDLQQKMLEHVHPVYLNGQWMLRGDSWYFLDALAYKLPHILQVAVVLGIITLAREDRSTRLAMLWIVLPALLLISIASLQKAQLGIRYILPAFPALFLLAGAALTRLPVGSARRRAMALAVLALVCGTSLRFHPHHLTYFNEAAGGPVGGRKYLLDSNLDWGQDLHLVKNWMETHGESRIQLAYFGMVEPKRLGIDYDIPLGDVLPGWYAISVNFVEGRPSGAVRPDGGVQILPPGAYEVFHSMEPAERLGYSIDLYHVTPEMLER